MKVEVKGYYRVYVDAFLRLSELFGKYNEKDDLYIELPDVEGLDEAVCLINKLCSQKVQKMEEVALDMFCAQQYNKIKRHVESGNVKPDLVRTLMKETTDYYKGKK